MSDTPETPDETENAATAADAPQEEAAEETTAEAAAPGDDPTPAEDDPIATLAAEKDELRSKLAYALAEADNARKRAAKDVADAREFAIQRFAVDLLSVSDNLTRALAALTPDARDAMGDAGKNLAIGVEMTRKELHAVFSRNGLTPIAADPGDRFDPNLHQAAAQIPAPQPAGAIADSVQDGWRLGERTIRAAIVAVSSGPPAGAAPVDAEAEADEPPATDATAGDPQAGRSGAAAEGDGPKPGGTIDTTA